MTRAEAGIEHLPRHVAIPFGIGITCLHYDLAVKFDAVLLSECRQRSVGNRNQTDFAKSQRVLDGTGRAVGSAGRHQGIEIFRMAGTETNLVARLRQKSSNQSADMAGTDNSDFHAATITPVGLDSLCPRKLPKRKVRGKRKVGNSTEPVRTNA